MKSVLLILSLNELLSLKLSKNNSTEINLKNITYSQMGLLNTRRNGPIDENEAENNEEDDSGSSVLGLVTFSNSLRNKHLKSNRTSIKGEGIKLLFPTDTKGKKIKQYERNYFENDEQRDQRIIQEKEEIIDSHRAFQNEFYNVFSKEDQFLNDKEKKYLMNLSIEKEQEIYNKMVNNELDETVKRSYHTGIQTHDIYKGRY